MKTCALVLLCVAAAHGFTAVPMTSSLYQINPSDGLYSLKTGLPYAFLRKRRDVDSAAILREKREVDQDADGSAFHYIMPLQYPSLGYSTLGHQYVFRKKRDVDQEAEGSSVYRSRYSRLGFSNRRYNYYNYGNQYGQGW